MRIDIVSDTICPWCFIGKRRLERALAGWPGERVEIGWRPFQLNPEMPSAGMDRHAYLETKFGGAERAQRVYTPIIEAGLGEGIAFAFDKIRRTPNTLLSHRLIRHAGDKGRQGEVVEALFRGYFLSGQDIGDVEIATEIAVSAGLGRDETRTFLASDAEREDVAAEESLARSLGIQGVPCFIIDRRVMVSGAQPADVLARAFDRAVADRAEAGVAS